VRPHVPELAKLRIMKLQAGSNPAILLLPQSLLKKSSTQELPEWFKRRSH